MSSSKGISPPKLIKDMGSLHPINHMKHSIMELLVSFGFKIIEGPEIETEEFNFDMLNIKKYLVLLKGIMALEAGYLELLSSLISSLCNMLLEIERIRKEHSEHFG